MHFLCWSHEPVYLDVEIEEGKDVLMNSPPQMGKGGVTSLELYPDCGTGKTTEVVAILNNYLYGQKDAARECMAAV